MAGSRPHDLLAIHVPKIHLSRQVAEACRDKLQWDKEMEPGKEDERFGYLISPSANSIPT